MNPVNVAEKEATLVRTVKVQPRIALTPAERRVLNLFNGATEQDWEDWRWQLKNRIKTKELLAKVIRLSSDEEAAIDKMGSGFSMSVTPYFASLMDPRNAACPIRRQSVPLISEFDAAPEEMRDPCGEDAHSPVHGLVHRYPDRVLFLVNEMCAMYCRFCTRSRMVGDGKRTVNTSTYEAAFQYIRKHKEVRDVLISGGDPLLLGNELLEYVIKNVSSIPHVEFVRVGTRVPVVLPQRVSADLVRMLKKYHPLWLSIHFDHPREITPRVKQACAMLADAGLPLGSQTVLLKGINDSPEVMKKLMHELLRIRIKPYYIYQCDPILGSHHFRTPLSVGLDIMEHLRGFTTGYAVPTFVVDAPGGGGKIPLSPNYVVSQQDKQVVLRNYDGEQFVHQDPS